MKEHFPTAGPEGIKKYEVLVEESSMRNDGTFFKDHLVHKILEKNGFERVGNEWFKCTPGELKAAIIAAKDKESMNLEREHNFSLRPEQKEAVEITSKYFKSFKATGEKHLTFYGTAKCDLAKLFCI